VVARARRLLPLVAALVLCLAVAPTALGASLKAPKWLKKPYREYTMTAQYGMDEEAGETDTGGSSCYGSNDSYQSSFKGQGTLTYKFLFGRWHNKKTRKYQSAFVYKAGSFGSSAGGNASEHWTAPSGCPASTSDSACSWSTGLDKPEVDAGRATTHRFFISVSAPDAGIDGGTSSCSGPPIQTVHSFSLQNGIAQPDLVTVDSVLIFSDSAVKAGKSFHTPVKPGDRDGGNDGDTNDGNASWTTVMTTSGGLTLTPSK
jgi:hypothetical protein